MGFLSVFVDGLMAFLLAITIFFCWKLNGRIKTLQDNKNELAETIQEFDACTQRAAQSIAEIHTATQRISENIQHKIDKANFVADDLEMMISRSNKLMGKPGADSKAKASGVKERVSSARKAAPKPRAAFVDAPTDDAEAVAPKATAKPERVRSRAERELIEAVKTGEDEIV